METLRKTVNICCLIFGLYGLISLMQLGTFVPPIPVRPILFVVILLVYCSKIKILKDKLLVVFLFIIWLTTLIFVGPYLMESWGSYALIQTFYTHFVPAISWFSIISFFLFSSILFFSIVKRKNIFLMLLLIPFSFLLIMWGNQSFYDWGMIITALFVFIIDKISKHKAFNYEKEIVVLNGVAVILLIERLSYLLN